MIERLLVNTFRFFEGHRVLFWWIFLGVAGLLTWGTVSVRLEENIDRMFPDDERVKKLGSILNNSSFSERLVVMVSVRDSSERIPADTLVAVTERLSGQLKKALEPYGTTVTPRIDDQKVLDVFHIARENLPVFLTDEDYQVLDSLTRPFVSREVIRNSYRQLVSPAGVVLKNMIVHDPMGFSFIALNKLQKLQYDENFELYDGYLLTKDHRHLLFFISPPHRANETGKNLDFIDALREVTYSHTDSDKILVSFFGAASVAVGNSKQLRSDTILTLSLLVVLLTVLIIGFFRNARVLPLILIPALFGVLFSLSCINLIQGSVSILAVAAGSAILGIAVNYALHFLVQRQFDQEPERVIRELAGPMMLGSLTTVLAFFGLHFTNAAVLKDIGLFAGFSLIGAVICSLIFLPHLTGAIRYSGVAEPKSTFIKDGFVRWVVIVILLATPVLLYFATQVRFNSNMSKLNFMSEETRQAQQRLERISPASLHTAYIATDGKTMEAALRSNEAIMPAIDSMIDRDLIHRYYSPALFLPSDSLQRERIRKWAAFWSPQRKEAFLRAVNEEGLRLKFAPSVLANVAASVERDYQVMDSLAFKELREAFFHDSIIRDGDNFTILSLINVLPESRETVQHVLSGISVELLDRQMITNLFIEYVYDDFSFIVTFTSILVFVVLLISYGRIELAVLTFIPMLITWIWILGIMAIVGIEFNIVNVMISTFIFGLGDDFSIFIMDRLVEGYKSGKPKLESTRISITLSALTTICGLGVLIFAKHPALQSIAATAIIGIVCVLIMSQTLEPYLFSLLISNRVKRGRRPMTARGMLFTAITYGIFVLGSFFLTVVGLILRILPVGRHRIAGIYHALIAFFTGIVMKAALNLRRNVLNESGDAFSRPGIIIANHSSFLDILMTAMMHRKVILLTSQWVWNSPIFGGVVRFAGYYPVTEGIDNSISKLGAVAARGYTIVVFPEGTRSSTGNIGRFHKGAFYIAERLHLPIYPLLIQGASEAIPKSTIYLNDAYLNLKLLPAIEPDDRSYGDSYSERTKRISRFFKEEHAKFAEAMTTPESVKYKLFSNYIYKGPILEWYLRIKLRLERYYEIFNSLVPRKGRVLDLGCGYGFLCYSLYFVSPHRLITGVDYDENKIATASGCIPGSDNVKFVVSDVVLFEFERYDAIILADVLHYLKPEEQRNLLVNCFQALNEGGKIIVRDGDADLTRHHKRTRLTEFFSVKLLAFNRAKNELHYISGSELKRFASTHGFHVETVREQQFTSNVTFVFTRQHETV